MVDGSMVRYCRSVDEYGNEGCGFEWPEKDDWKYHVVLMYFDTEEEYEAAL
jgi:hypothetical protein